MDEERNPYDADTVVVLNTSRGYVAYSPKVLYDIDLALDSTQKPRVVHSMKTSEFIRNSVKL